MGWGPFLERLGSSKSVMQDHDESWARISFDWSSYLLGRRYDRDAWAVRQWGNAWDEVLARFMLGPRRVLVERAIAGDITFDRASVFEFKAWPSSSRCFVRVQRPRRTDLIAVPIPWGRNSARVQLLVPRDVDCAPSLIVADPRVGPLLDHVAVGGLGEAFKRGIPVLTEVLKMLHDGLLTVDNVDNDGWELRAVREVMAHADTSQPFVTLRYADDEAF